MSETVLEQSLQVVMQETTAAAVLAGLLAAGLVGMSIRSVVESVVSREETDGEPISDGGTVEVVADEQSRPSESSDTAHRETESPDRDGIDTIETGTDRKSTEETEHPEKLERRLDTLENEVGSLSSTVNTVRNENEQISESVQDIEESTGRLLNLYEMATRGVNPFADTEEKPPKRHPETESRETETIQTDVADPDAAALFNTTKEEGTASGGPVIREEHCVDSVEEVVETETEPADAFQKRKQSEHSSASGSRESTKKTADGVEEISNRDGEFEDASASQTEDEGSFGKEEMIETPSPAAEPAASDGGTLIEPEQETTDAVGEDSAASGSAVEEPSDSVPELSSPVPETPTEETKSDPETREKTTTESHSKGPVEDTSAVTTPSEQPTAADGKPYLESLPEGFAAEVITVEWLEYLIDEVGLKETLRAIQYYEKIDWLTAEAADELDSYLDGFNTDEQGRLSVEHHLQSLDYVEELTVTGADESGEDSK